MDDQFDLLDLVDAPIASVPWVFRVGRYLSRKKIRGGDRLLSEARKRGLLDCLAVYPLSERVSLRVPLWRPCNQWDEQDVHNYEAAFIRALSNSICGLTSDVTLIDCGADIGTVSAHLVARCPNIRNVVAFEPNPAAYSVLAQNVGALGVRGAARNAAVADFSGRGQLVNAPDDPSAHAMFIEPSDGGSIPVERVDDLGLTPSACAIKIDVEGSEATVVAGAQRTIQSAGQVVVAFEAHYRVYKRTGQDPLEVMQALLALRPSFTFEVDTTPTQKIRGDVPFFEQLPPTRVYNVIARSVGA